MTRGFPPITDKVMVKNYNWRMSLTTEQRENLRRLEDQEIFRIQVGLVRREQWALAYEKFCRIMAAAP